jgi:intraflagellar transport protein 52
VCSSTDFTFPVKFFVFVSVSEKVLLYFRALKFVYPYGATLNVARPAVAVLSTGSVAFPLNRPVCALYTHTNASGSPGGKLAVLGSVHIFSDKYIDKEDNDKVRDVLFRFLTSSDIELNQIDADDPEVNFVCISCFYYAFHICHSSYYSCESKIHVFLQISDYIMVPDTARLAEKPRVCLQESVDEIPTDYTKLFNQRLFSINTGCVPAAIQAYQDLNVKHEPLRLITPQFETPLPPLQAAVIIYCLTHFTIVILKLVYLFFWKRQEYLQGIYTHLLLPLRNGYIPRDFPTKT